MNGSRREYGFPHIALTPGQQRIAEAIKNGGSLVFGGRHAGKVAAMHLHRNAMWVLAAAGHPINWYDVPSYAEARGVFERSFGRHGATYVRDRDMEAIADVWH